MSVPSDCPPPTPPNPTQTSYMCERAKERDYPPPTPPNRTRTSYMCERPREKKRKNDEKNAFRAVEMCRNARKLQKTRSRWDASNVKTQKLCFDTRPSTPAQPTTCNCCMSNEAQFYSMVETDCNNRHHPHIHCRIFDDWTRAQSF